MCNTENTERVERIRADEARPGDRIKAPEGRAFHELTVAEHKPGLDGGSDMVELGTGWGSVILDPSEIVERENWQTGDAAAEVEKNLRDRVDHYLALERATNNPAEMDEAILDRLDLGAEHDDHELQNEGHVIDAAQNSINQWPLAVESMVTFEVVLGTGGPDDRFLIECDIYKDGGFEDSAPEYTIRRVLYRYSWTGSAEIVLDGEDKEAAEAFARRVVPELAE